VRAAVITGVGQVSVETVDDPTPGPRDVVVEVAAAGICGTDLHAYEGTQPYFEYPRILGHELAGDLVDLDKAPGFVVGDAVTVLPYFNCGHCIACRNGKPNCCTSIKVCGVHIDGGMVEYLSVPSPFLVYNEGLDHDQLALVEPLAIGAHAVRRAAVQPDEFVLVVGAGPIGLGVMESARIAGGQVIAMDINEGRLEFCRDKLHLLHTVNASGVDVMEPLTCRGRRGTGRPSCSSTGHLLSASPGPISSGSAAGSNPSATVPRRKSRQRLPLMCCNRPRPLRAGPLPSYGSSVASQQWQSNPRGPARTPASEPKSSPPTGPAGDAHATLEPPRRSSAGAPYMNP